MTDSLTNWQRLVTFGFRLLYNELAWTYDIVAWTVSLGHWTEWVESALDELNPGTNSHILELAHGPGHLQQRMIGRGLAPTGLDLSPAMGRIAKARLTKISPAPALVRGQAQSLPFATDQFDGVVCTFPTPFIFEQQTLDEARRVLKPGRTLVILLGAQLTGPGPLSAFIEWLYKITGQREGLPSQWMDRFETAGLTADYVYKTIDSARVLMIIAKKKTG